MQPSFFSIDVASRVLLPSVCILINRATLVRISIFLRFGDHCAAKVCASSYAKWLCSKFDERRPCASPVTEHDPCAFFLASANCSGRPMYMCADAIWCRNNQRTTIRNVGWTPLRSIEVAINCWMSWYPISFVSSSPPGQTSSGSLFKQICSFLFSWLLLFCQLRLK